MKTGFGCTDPGSWATKPSLDLQFSLFSALKHKKTKRLNSANLKQNARGRSDFHWRNGANAHLIFGDRSV